MAGKRTLPTTTRIATTQTIAGTTATEVEYRHNAGNAHYQQPHA